MPLPRTNSFRHVFQCQKIKAGIYADTPGSIWSFGSHGRVGDYLAINQVRPIRRYRFLQHYVYLSSGCTDAYPNLFPPFFL